MDSYQISNYILKYIENNEFQTYLYNKLIKEFCKREDLSSNDIYSVIEDVIFKDGELNEELNNLIFSQSFKYIDNPKFLKNSVKDNNNYLFQAQVSWEKRIIKSINSMCSEFQIPLVKKRSDKEVKEIREKWTELSSVAKESGSIRPIYAPKDFLEVLIKLKINNCKITPPLSSEINSWLHNWGLIQVPLKVKSIQELRTQLYGMAIGQQQIGVDDTNRTNSQFELDRHRIAIKMIESKNAAACQEFAKKGCQLEHRRKLWYSILNINITDASRHYYNQLKQNVFENDLLVDSLLFMEVKLTATNDDAYFIFEDYLYQILLPFSRDPTLLNVFERTTGSPAKILIRGKSNGEPTSVFYPPSGIIPFHGFSMLVVPLCYFIDDPVELYICFKEMYSRYFHKLHMISDDPQGILSLCLLFESLLQNIEPDLFFYLRSLGIQPIRLAFKWIMRGFSGFLAVDQVLLLWDRIIGFESLEMLSLTAVAIFSFRSSNLMNVKTQTAAEAVLADLTTLQIIPLLQLTLFSR